MKLLLVILLFRTRSAKFHNTSHRSPYMDYGKLTLNSFISKLFDLKINNIKIVCGKIVHETATHQMTVEFKLIQVPLRPSTMNQSQYHNGSCKRPRNTKCETTHNRPNLFQKQWTNNNKWLIKQRKTTGINFDRKWHACACIYQEIWNKNPFHKDVTVLTHKRK